jgi:hypothetical protein
MRDQGVKATSAAHAFVTVARIVPCKLAAIAIGPTMQLHDSCGDRQQCRNGNGGAAQTGRWRQRGTDNARNAGRRQCSLPGQHPLAQTVRSGNKDGIDLGYVTSFALAKEGLTARLALQRQ